MESGRRVSREADRLARRSGRTGARGFTIIEVLLVLLVIGVIAAMVIPRVGILDGTYLAAAARSLAGTIYMTRATAIMKKTPHRIHFNLDEGTYTVEEKRGEDFVRSAEPLLQPRVLPDHIYFKRIEILDQACEPPCELYLYISSSGYVDPASIYLGIVDDERVMSILTRPLLGKAEIVPGEISREEWEKGEAGP